MKYVRFDNDGKIAYGVLSGNQIQELAGDLFSQPTFSGKQFPVANVKLLAPCLPSKAICIGLNYRDHASEMKHDLPKEPLFFIKPATTLNDPDGEIRYPAISRNVHHEAELAVVIGRKAKHVKAAEANDYVFGYTCANDVTARDIQMSDGNGPGARASTHSCRWGHGSKRKLIHIPWISRDRSMAKSVRLRIPAI